MLVVRPISSDDLTKFSRLAKKAGPGFTSLAVSEDVLATKLEKSVKSFGGEDVNSSKHHYLLVIEDTASGEIVGLSGIKAQVGIDDPFFNFRILNVAQKSAVTKRRFDMEVLILVSEYPGATEVGTLFVPEEMRGTGAGRLISQSRYMLMAAAPNRFSERVISELRGHVDAEGYSPFWEAIGRKFFHMDFVEADNVSAEQDNQFILDLMPKYPIYAALLPQEAQAVMGQTHPSGIGARRYLESEGFRYNGAIDIFDGGPSLSVLLTDVRTIRESQLFKTAETSDLNKQGVLALVSNDRVSDFRCIFEHVLVSGEHIKMSREALTSLRLAPGDTARVWIKQ